MLNYKRKKNFIIKVINVCVVLFLLCSCANKTIYQEQIYQKNKNIFLTDINSYIGKTPNDLYQKYGKPDEYTTDISKNKEIKGAHIIYEKVFNFKLQQYDCLITFNTDKTQKIINSVNYSSDKCFYLSQYEKLNNTQDIEIK